MEGSTKLRYREACSLLNFTKGKIKENKFKSILFELFYAEEGSKFLSKIKIEQFLNEHTVLTYVVKAIQEITANPTANVMVSHALRAFGMETINFGVDFKYRYIHNRDFYKLKQYYMNMYGHPDCEIYTKTELISKLGIQLHLIDSVLTEYKIYPYFKVGNALYYIKHDLAFLLNEQEKKLKQLNEKYTTTTQLKEITGEKLSNINRFIRVNGLGDHTIEVPSICRISSTPYLGAIRLIPKHLIKLYIEDVKRRNRIRELLRASEVNPFHTYLSLVDSLDIKFSKVNAKTQYYWESFVRSRLEKTIKTDEGLKDQIMLFVHATELLIRVTLNKEIFNFSAKEIELALMNANVPNSWQRDFYVFFNKLSSSFKEQGIRIFDINLIKNPKYKTNEKELHEKETYTVEEYINLIDYSKKAFHKEKATINAKAQLTGLTRSSYPQMWLYVIIQLNNVWNHKDVVSFPRLNLKFIDGFTLNWIEQNELTKEQAEMIVDYYRNTTFERKKSGKELKFLLADELISVFATSILICELIQREIYPLSVRLIDFENSSNTPTKKTTSEFFEHYNPKSEDFKFGNLVLNRTVLSCATDVIKKLTNGNPLDVIKFFRNHSDVETTNIYINVPTEYVNYLAEHLFNIGNFGFIYDNLAYILNGKELDREERTKNALSVKNSLGSIEKVESIAHCASAIASERNAVKEIVSEMTFEEVREKYNLLRLGLLPSKDDHDQCLVGMSNCPLEPRKCETCPLMVPNRYTLIKLNLKLNEKMDAFMQSYFNTPFEGEKIKLANHLYIYLDLAKQAIAKFGRETVENFVNIDEINEKLSSIPTFKENVSLIQKGRHYDE
ncbi:hypothetical protein CN481_00205 [Bacillus sp. AFS006103]|nr:hypothetical protein CN481_00205 [Bacillus sp. AFS006103]